MSSGKTRNASYLMTFNAYWNITIIISKHFRKRNKKNIRKKKECFSMWNNNRFLDFCFRSRIKCFRWVFDAFIWIWKFDCAIEMWRSSSNNRKTEEKKSSKLNQVERMQQALTPRPAHFIVCSDCSFLLCSSATFAFRFVIYFVH